MENKGIEEIVGNPDAPYENSLIGLGRSFDNYFGVTHPSLPNYLAFAAGSPCGKTGTDDVTAPDPTVTSSCDSTLWDQLTAASVTWGIYAEGMPGLCSDVEKFQDETVSHGPYALKHNPGPPFGSIHDSPQCQNVLPFTAFDPANLRQVSFVAPNMCNDQHGSGSGAWTDCLHGSSELIRRGDDWLGAHVPQMLANGATVFLTYDEDGDEGINGTLGGGHLYAVEVGPGVAPGSHDAAQYNHYSLLGGIEDAFGLPHLRGATDVPALRL